MTLILRTGIGIAFLVACPSAVAQQITATGDFGALSATVATAGTLIAAVGALLLCWKGPFNWEPAEEDLPRSAQKVGSLLIGIAIAIIWFRFQHKLLTSDGLQMLCIQLGVGVLLAFVCYGLLISIYVYDIIVGVGNNETKPIKIIGGFWITSEARRLMAGGAPANVPPGVVIPTPATITDLLVGLGYKVDIVWSRLSRGLAKGAFQLAYIALVGCGTCALTAASILLALATV